MKTNFFKIVLPAFAFMLAIITSLAFTSNVSDEADDTVWFWDDTVTPQKCIEISIDNSILINCNHSNFGHICVVTIIGQNQNPKDLYSGPPCSSAQLLRRP